MDGFRLAYDRAGSGPPAGVGDRVLSPDAQREFWYQSFHRLAPSTELIDGRREAVATDAQLRVLDGVGHFVPLQAPDDVAGAIRAATGTSA